MNKKTLFLIGIQTAIIIVLFWMLIFYGKDEYEAIISEQGEAIENPSLVTQKEGISYVTLPVKSQQQSGISTSQLQSSNYQASASAFGTVIDITQLIEIRARYLSAYAEAEVSRASIASKKQEYERLKLLNQDNKNISDHAVAVAEAAWKSAEARLNADQTATRGLRDNMRQQWGEYLAKLALQQPPGKIFEHLLARKQTLLQITLPEEFDPPATGSTLLVEIAGRQKPITAVFVSAATQTDNTIQGRTFYYRAPAQYLRTGMKVRVSLTTGQQQSGVIVPASAVVWYANQAWVYRKQGDDTFVRTPITTDNEVGRGWFTRQGVEPGENVVTTGAQLLLSEEFKYQITNENED